MIVFATLSLATTSEQAAVRKTSPTALDAKNRPNPERVIIDGSSWIVRTVRPSRDGRSRYGRLGAATPVVLRSAL